MGIMKIIELVGVSKESSDRAVREAVYEAGKTIRGISHIEVTRVECVVSENDIVEWHATVKLRFPVERS